MYFYTLLNKNRLKNHCLWKRHIACELFFHVAGFVLLGTLAGLLYMEDPGTGLLTREPGIYALVVRLDKGGALDVRCD